MKLLPRRLIYIGLIVLGFAAIVATPAASLPKGDTVGDGTSNGQATAPREEHPPNWDQINQLVVVPAENISTDQPATVPPPAEQNPCLHCHIAGEIYNEWSPISRWFVFGAMGLTFVFGLTRNFIVWRTRELWHHRWMYYVGNIAALFFVIQVSSGIILFLLGRATPEIITQIVAITQAIHWFSGIIIFIAALGFSLAGLLLPWFQRPFWTLLLITAIIGSTLAVANLSFAYLYADWHTPLPPSLIFIYHMLLSPIAITSLMSIYFIRLRKRGGTQ